MKRLLSIMVCLATALASMANGSAADVKLDSLSYALGFRYTSTARTDCDSIMLDKHDYEEYMRGLEERIPHGTLLNDSSFIVSYAVGGIAGAFMTDGHTNEKDVSSFPYIIEGVRKVADGRIVLPADTIEAMAVINRYSEDDRKTEDLDENAKREFFMAYGIMKTFQPGVQEYIKEIKPGTNVEFDRQAYAAGMADVLEGVLTEEPMSAYELGKTVAFSATIGTFGIYRHWNMFTPSFIAGAKAALDLGEQLIEKDLLESILNKWNERESVVTEKSDNDEQIEKLVTYQNQLDIEMFEMYSVNWNITANKVATEQSPVSKIFRRFLKKTSIENAGSKGVLLVVGVEESSTRHSAIETMMKKFPLPEGYKWFYGRRDDNTLTIGIMETAGVFNGSVHKASVEANNTSGIYISFSFAGADVAKWSDFTDANVGNSIALFVNGIFACAPRINSQITGGVCSVNGLSAEDVNKLFYDAVPVSQETPVDSVVIE